MDQPENGTETRKLVAYELLSLDGVAEDPSDFITEWDAAMDENLGRVIASQDAVLLGRRTYDDWAAFWPSSEIEPFSSFINAVQKFVVTSTPLEDEWRNVTVFDGDDLLAAVTRIKAQPGGDIGVHGSISLTQALLQAELIDELRLVVAPALQTPGRKLFETTKSTPLVLTRCRTSPTGSLLLDYQLRR
jgi:dihydrofolate reductase